MIKFDGHSGSDAYSFWLITNWLAIFNDTDGRWDFNLDNDGNVWIGILTPSTKLHVMWTVRSNSTNLTSDVK